MKKMTKLVSLVLSLVLLTALLAGCGSSGTTLADVQEKGQLVMATSPDFPPFESLDADGNVIGIEVEIMEAVCEALGVEAVFAQAEFDSVLPGVQAGKYDIGMSGITVTEKRQKSVLFTDPYCLAAQSIVVRDDSPITCKADLEGKTVSVQTGTTSETFCTEQGYTVNSYATNSDAKLALTTGKVDAWVIDDLTAADMVATYNAENTDQLIILDEPMTTEPYAFAMKLGSDDLAAAINDVVNAMVADGTMQAIFDKYNAPYTAPTL